jgi:hypothetical protein
MQKSSVCPAITELLRTGSGLVPGLARSVNYSKALAVFSQFSLFPSNKNWRSTPLPTFSDPIIIILRLT